MASWVTVRDDPSRQARLAAADGSSDTETAEVKLYAMRSLYHKALILQQESEAVGDSRWEGARAGLVALVTQLEAQPHNSRSWPGSASTGGGESPAQISFHNDCQHILYLSQKNLSRMLEQEQGPQPRYQALSLALAACAVMFALGHSDAGLLFRTALLARAQGDDWTCRQLLGALPAPQGGLYVGATAQLLRQLRTPSGPPLCLAETWRHLHPASPCARKEGAGEGPGLAWGLEALVRTLAAASSAADGGGGGALLLRLLRTALQGAGLQQQGSGGGGGRAASAVQEERGRVGGAEAGARPLGQKRPREEEGEEEGGEEEEKREQEGEQGGGDGDDGTLEPSSSGSSSSSSAAAADLSSGQQRRSGRTARRAPRLEGEAASASQGAEAPDDLWPVYCGILGLPPPPSCALPGCGNGPWAASPTLPALMQRCLQQSASCTRRLQASFRRRSLEQEPGASAEPAVLLAAIYRDGVAPPEAAYARLCSLLLGGSAHVASVLEAFLSAVSSTVLGRHDPASAARAVGGMALVAPAVAAAWAVLCSCSNMHLEARLAALGPEEQQLLAECCAEVARRGRQADAAGGASASASASSHPHAAPHVQALCSATLHLLLPACQAAAQDESLASASPRDAALRVRRLWLQATHSLLWGDAPAAAAAALAALGPVLRAAECMSLTLPHCGAWAVVDPPHCLQLSAALLDDGCLHGLVQSHTLSPDWLQAALGALSTDEELAAAATAGARRGTGPSQWLPLLCLRTCAALGQPATWLQLATRVLEVALPAVVALLREGCNERDKALAWLARVISEMADSAPAAIPTPEGGIEEWAAAVSDAVWAASALTLSTFSSALTPAYEAAWAFLLRCCSALNSGLATAAECFEGCAAALCAQPKDQVDVLVLPTAQFGLQLAAAGGVSAAVLGTDDVLGRLACACLQLYNVWWERCRTVVLATTTVVLHCCTALSTASHQARLEALLAYHAFACDEDLWALDQGQTLLCVAQALHAAVTSSSGGFAAAFPMMELTLVQQTDTCSCLGEMYWLLYAFPLCSFSYSDDRGETVLFHLPLQPAVVATLYAFYQYCTGLGMGHKSDRRAALQMLTRSPPLLQAAQDSRSFTTLTRLVFSRPAPVTRTAGTQLLLELTQQAAEQEQELGLLAPVVASIYADRASYLTDAVREIPEAGEVSEKLPQTERWHVHAMHLCLLDLANNPTRTEMWGTLYYCMADYLLLLCDQVGEACVPSGLSEGWHLALALPDPTFEGLRDGHLRLDTSVAARARDHFLARDAPAHITRTGSLATLVAAAWGVLGAHSVEEDALRLAGTIAFKNFLLGSLERVFAMMLAAHSASSHSTTASAPASEATDEAAQAVAGVLLSRGRLLLTMSHEYPEESKHRREQHAAALLAFQAAAALGCTGTYLLTTAARLQWTNCHQMMPALALLTRSRQGVVAEASKSPLRVCALSESSSILGDIALSLLRSGDSSASVDVVNALSTEANYAHKFSRYAHHIGRGALEAGEQHSPTDLLWLALVNCVANFREVRRVDAHDFRSVYGLSVLLHSMARGPAPPAWAAAQLSLLDVPQLSAAGAFREMRKLFTRRHLPQLVAIWSQGKAVHEYDYDLQKLYTFEAMRRQYIGLFLQLAEVCGELQSALDLLSCALAVQNKKQTATVRWVVDRAAQCVAGMVLHSTLSVSPDSQLLKMVFEIFQVCGRQNRVSQHTLYRLQRTLLKVHATERPGRSVGPAGPEAAKPTLSGCLQACFDEFGAKSRTDCTFAVAKVLVPVAAAGVAGVGAGAGPMQDSGVAPSVPSIPVVDEMAHAETEAEAANNNTDEVADGRTFIVL